LRGKPACLPRSFYARPALVVAGELLGKVLVHRAPDGETSGRIVEVEAYIGADDPACHAAPGPTRRNEPLYGEPGHAYVYFNYGVHDMFNVVAEPRGRPAAILVRALEPLDGADLMRRRRDTPSRGRKPKRQMSLDDLCRGPGNVARAMGITLADNRADLCGSELFIEDRGLDAARIGWSPRIGIKVGVDRPWRCYVVGSKAVSGRRSS
jgi:DNA-3-methyladenine glycosylase